MIRVEFTNTTLSPKVSNTTEPTYIPSNDDLNKLTPIELCSAFMLALLFVVGTVGNSLTIWVFMWKKKKKHRKRFELLLSGLALSDLISSILVPSLFFYATVTKFKRWDFGDFGCKFISSMFPVTVTFSQGFLVLISYDRYRSLSNPFGKAIKGTFVVGWLVLTFAIACVLVSPYYDAMEVVSYPEYGINTCNPSGLKTDSIYLYSMGNVCRDFVATISMIILGVMTNRSLKAGGLLGSVGVFKRRQENANKARKMLIVVVCVFSFCVIPMDLYQVAVYTVVYKLNIQISVDTFDLIKTGNTFLLVLQIANSSTNFIIYSKMNRSFGRTLLSCIRKGKYLARTSFRSTFRSTRSESLDSFSNAGALLAVLPITPGGDNVFSPNVEGNKSKETQFNFDDVENNNNIANNAHTSKPLPKSSN